jgi:TBC1 domain family member 2
LERKRNEYRDMLLRHYSDATSIELSQEWLNSATQLEKGVLHQIRIDVPRTLPHNKMYRSEQAQNALERILFIWALRHPASSYVQGINDLVTPFYSVFIKEQLQLAQQRRDGVPSDLCAAVQLVDLNHDPVRRATPSDGTQILESHFF